MNLKGVAAASHTRNLRSDHEKTFKKAINFRERLKLKTKTITRPFVKYVGYKFQIFFSTKSRQWFKKYMDKQTIGLYLALSCLY